MAKKKNKNAHVPVTISLTKQIWLAIVQGQSWPSLWYVNTESFERDFRLSPMLANGTHGEVIESQGTRKASLGRIFCHLTWQEGKKKNGKNLQVVCVRHWSTSKSLAYLSSFFNSFQYFRDGNININDHVRRQDFTNAEVLYLVVVIHTYIKRKASEFLNQLTGHQSPGTQRVWKGSRRVKTNKQLQVTASFKLLMY